jgi:hypothetical protein
MINLLFFGRPANPAKSEKPRPAGRCVVELLAIRQRVLILPHSLRNFHCQSGVALGANLGDVGLGMA